MKLFFTSNNPPFAFLECNQIFSLKEVVLHEMHFFSGVTQFSFPVYVSLNKIPFLDQLQ